jgi:hypothetical protein
MENLSENTTAAGRLDAPVMLSSREANTGYLLKGDFQQMAKRRFQQQAPFRDGAWCGLDRGSTISPEANTSGGRNG